MTGPAPHLLHERLQARGDAVLAELALQQARAHAGQDARVVVRLLRDRGHERRALGQAEQQLAHAQQQAVRVEAVLLRLVDLRAVVKPKGTFPGAISCPAHGGRVAGQQRC